MPKAKILVVDDDPDFVEFLRTVLEANDYKVVSAGNSDQGMLMLDREKPDLVVLDVIMSSVLDGLSMSQRMADDPASNTCPSSWSHPSPTPTTWPFSPPTRAFTLTRS